MTLNDVIYSTGFVMNGARGDDPRSVDLHTTDSFEVVFPLRTALLTVVCPGPMPALTRAGDDLERVTDIGPLVRLVLIGENESFRSMGWHVCVDVEAPDALFPDTSSGFLWGDRFNIFYRISLADTGPPGVFPERYKPDVGPTVFSKDIQYSRRRVVRSLSVT